MASPYNYIFHEPTQSYKFTTKNQIEYSIVFSVDELLSNTFKENIDGIWHLLIDKITDKKAPLDVRVSDTINEIVTLFFENTQNSILYFCADDDGKEEKRFNAFERWYQKSSLPNFVSKIDKVIDLDEAGKYYSSLLYHKKNDNYLKIIAAYDKMFED